MYGPARYGLGPYHQRLRTRRRPDDEVRKDVEDALFYDTWVDAEAITVEVKDGVVTLKGELPDYHEVRYATDDAWDVDGVRGVHCQLTVNPGKRPPVDGVPARTGPRQRADPPDPIARRPPGRRFCLGMGQRDRRLRPGSGCAGRGPPLPGPLPRKLRGERGEFDGASAGGGVHGGRPPSPALPPQTAWGRENRSRFDMCWCHGHAHHPAKFVPLPLQFRGRGGERGPPSGAARCLTPIHRTSRPRASIHPQLVDPHPMPPRPQRPTFIDRFRRSLDALGVRGADAHVLVAVSGGCDSVVAAAPAALRGGRRGGAGDGGALRPRDAARGASATRRGCAGSARAWGVPLIAGAGGGGRRGRRRRRGTRATPFSAARRRRRAPRTWPPRTTRTTRRRPCSFASCAAPGSPGWPGFRPRGDGGLVRPLLPFWRAEILRYARAAGLAWREDPTNALADPARNRIRLRLLPQIERHAGAGGAAQPGASGGAGARGRGGVGRGAGAGARGRAARGRRGASACPRTPCGL